MTDLKHLFEEAAGDEPAITDQDLAGDLRRGKHSARRRQLTGVVAGVAATALVIGGGWTLLPGSDQPAPAGDQGVAGKPSPTPKKPFSKQSSRPRPPTQAPPPEETLPAAPKPEQPVELVPDGVIHKGTDLVCDLKPKGWKAKVEGGGGGWGGSLNFVHPKYDGSGRYYHNTTRITVRHAVFIDGGNGRKLVEKYSNTWEELRAYHRKAGKRTAVVSGSSMGPDTNANGLREYFVRMAPTKLIAVHNSATPLGWDLPTTLRFVGSCHYAN